MKPTRAPSELVEGPELSSISLAAALKVWLKIGLLSFGGPAGQIALMHKELVEDRKWIDEERFLHALNYCMLLPGPEAQQLATYIGWLMHRARGGLAAGLLFVLPGFLAILGLSALYVGFGELPAVSAVFFGLKAAVLAVVAEAVLRIGKRALHGRPFYWIAGLAFVAIFFFRVPFPLIILMAGACGALWGRFDPARFSSPPSTETGASHDTVIARLAARGELDHTAPSLRRALRVVLIAGFLWFAPLAVLYATLGEGSVFVQEGIFFSKTASITFGGAYAVLAYVAQRAVETYGWLQPGEMLDGLGLAETTPGPLIMVVEFVGFLGAYRNPGSLTPMVSGVLGALITVWVTFVPCFFWIFLGGPFIERLRSNQALRAALACITAAVVGVILNLSLWLALHTVFREVQEFTFGPLHLSKPILKTIDFGQLLLGTLALLAMFRLKLGLTKTLLGSVFLGILWKIFVA